MGQVIRGRGIGCGCGCGSGNGDGNGSGNGDGRGYGYGDGYGDGSGYGSGYGYVYGDGSGYGSGYGHGYGDGSGYGSGYGCGCGDGIIEIDHNTPILAYHCVSTSGILRHPHRGARPMVKEGLVLVWEGELVLCREGLHASIRLADARKYVPVGIATKVACSGRVIFDKDKLVCTRREVIAVLGS